MATKSYGSITIVDITDIGEFSVQPTANLPLTVIYSPDQGTYTPNWADSPLQLVPVIYYAGKQVTLGSTGLTVTWAKRDGVATTAEGLGEGEANNNGVLNVTKNQFNTNSSMISYVVTAKYVEPTSGQTLTAEGQITFSLVKQASSIRSCRITGESIFKYNGAGKAVGDTSITLTAQLDNVYVKEWQYQAADGTWTKYPGSTASSTLVVKDTDAVFVNDTATIKLTTTDNSDLTTDDDTIYDIHVITKLRDGAAGQSTISAVLTNDDQMIPFSNKGVGDFSEATSRIIVYEGGTDVTAQYTITQKASGCTATASKTNVTNDTVTVSAMTGTTANVTFTATKSGSNPITKTFSLVKVTSGADGGSPIIYSVETSTLAMNRATTGALTPSNVTFSAYSLTSDTTGAQKKNTYAGRFGIYENVDFADITTDTERKYYSQSDEATCTYTPSTTAETVVCLLYRSGVNPNGASTNQLDHQTVVVTRDGKQGGKGATGSQGDAAINVIMGNSADVIPCTSANRTQVAMTIEIPFSGYQGTTRIPVTGPTAANAKLFGITPTVTNATASGDGKITWSIPAGTEVSASSGTLSLSFTASGTQTTQAADGTTSKSTIQRQIVHDYRWTRSTAATNGQNAVILTIGTPSGGNIITNGSGSIVLEATLYDGSKDISTNSGVTWQWKKWNGTTYSNVSGATSRSKTVTASEIDGYASFKVEATYNGTTYSAFESCYDKTDPIQVSVFSSIGEQIINGNGAGALYVKVTRNGQEIDPIRSEYFGATSPQNPSAGDYYYKVDSAKKSLTLYRYSGTAWTAASEDYRGTYSWSYRDKDGNPYSKEGLATSGKVIYIDGSLIDSKIIADVEVTI